MENINLNNLDQMDDARDEHNSEDKLEDEVTNELENVVDEDSGMNQGKQKFIAVLLVIVSILGFVFYIQPTRADMLERELSLDALRSQEANLKNSLVNLQNASDTLDLDSEVKTSQLINAIPDKLNQDELLLNMVDIADKNDIEFQSISFGLSGDNQDEVKQVSISASFEGNYGDLVHFLKAIEDNGRKMVVDNISVQLLGEAVNGIERVHFSLSILAFYRNGI